MDRLWALGRYGGKIPRRLDLAWRQEIEATLKHPQKRVTHRANGS